MKNKPNYSRHLRQKAVSLLLVFVLLLGAAPAASFALAATQESTSQQTSEDIDAPDGEPPAPSGGEEDNSTDGEEGDDTDTSAPDAEYPGGETDGDTGEEACAEEDTTEANSKEPDVAIAPMAISIPGLPTITSDEDIATFGATVLINTSGVTGLFGTAADKTIYISASGAQVVLHGVSLSNTDMPAILLAPGVTGAEVYIAGTNTLETTGLLPAIQVPQGTSLTIYGVDTPEYGQSELFANGENVAIGGETGKKGADVGSNSEGKPGEDGAANGEINIHGGRYTITGAVGGGDGGNGSNGNKSTLGGSKKGGNGGNGGCMGPITITGTTYFHLTGRLGGGNGGMGGKASGSNASDGTAGNGANAGLLVLTDNEYFEVVGHVGGGDGNNGGNAEAFITNGNTQLVVSQNVGGGEAWSGQGGSLESVDMRRTTASFGGNLGGTSSLGQGLTGGELATLYIEDSSVNVAGYVGGAQGGVATSTSDYNALGKGGAGGNLASLTLLNSTLCAGEYIGGGKGYSPVEGDPAYHGGDGGSLVQASLSGSILSVAGYLGGGDGGDGKQNYDTSSNKKGRRGGDGGTGGSLGSLTVHESRVTAGYIGGGHGGQGGQGRDFSLSYGSWPGGDGGAGGNVGSVTISGGSSYVNTPWLCGGTGGNSGPSGSNSGSMSSSGAEKVGGTGGTGGAFAKLLVQGGTLVVEESISAGAGGEGGRGVNSGTLVTPGTGGAGGAGGRFDDIEVTGGSVYAGDYIGGGIGGTGGKAGNGGAIDISSGGTGGAGGAGGELGAFTISGGSVRTEGNLASGAAGTGGPGTASTVVGTATKGGNGGASAGAGTFTILGGTLYVGGNVGGGKGGTGGTPGDPELLTSKPSASKGGTGGAGGTFIQKGGNVTIVGNLAGGTGGDGSSGHASGFLVRGGHGGNGGDGGVGPIVDIRGGILYVQGNVGGGIGGHGGNGGSDKTDGGNGGNGGVSNGFTISGGEVFIYLNVGGGQGGQGGEGGKSGTGGNGGNGGSGGGFHASGGKLYMTRFSDGFGGTGLHGGHGGEGGTGGTNGKKGSEGPGGYNQIDSGNIVPYSSRLSGDAYTIQITAEEQPMNLYGDEVYYTLIRVVDTAANLVGGEEMNISIAVNGPSGSYTYTADTFDWRDYDTHLNIDGWAGVWLPVGTHTITVDAGTRGQGKKYFTTKDENTNHTIVVLSEADTEVSIAGGAAFKDTWDGTPAKLQILAHNNYSGTTRDIVGVRWFREAYGSENLYEAMDLNFPELNLQEIDDFTDGFNAAGAANRGSTYGEAGIAITRQDIDPGAEVLFTSDIGENGIYWVAVEYVDPNGVHFFDTVYCVITSIYMQVNIPAEGRDNDDHSILLYSEANYAKDIAGIAYNLGANAANSTGREIAVTADGGATSKQWGSGGNTTQFVVQGKDIPGGAYTLLTSPATFTINRLDFAPALPGGVQTFYYQLSGWLVAESYVSVTDAASTAYTPYRQNTNTGVAGHNAYVRNTSTLQYADDFAPLYAFYEEGGQTHRVDFDAAGNITVPRPSASASLHITYVYLESQSMQLSVPVLMLWAAFDTGDGAISSPAYSFVNESPFAVDITLEAVDIAQEAGLTLVAGTTPTTQNTHTLWLEGAAGTKLDVADAAGYGTLANVGTLGKKNSPGNTASYQFAGQYEGAFTTHRQPRYNFTFRFSKN